MSAKLAEKQAQATSLRSELEASPFFVLAGFRGLTVSKLSRLRRDLRKGNNRFRIIKNTLIDKAVTDLPTFSGVDQFLSGPTALVYGGEDPVYLAKVLVDFQKENEQLVLKGGMLSNKLLVEKDLAALAKLPSREVLLGRLVGQLAAPISGLANVLQGPIRNLAYVLEAIRKEKVKEVT